MTLTIELSPESEARLKARAAASGTDVGKLVIAIVESNLQQTADRSMSGSDQEQQRLRDAIEESQRRIENLKPDPNRPHLRGQEAEIEELITQKFAKQRRNS